jgi:hypothetical protein
VNGEEYAYYRYYYGYGHGAGYYNDKPPAGITETSVVAKSPDDSD